MKMRGATAAHPTGYERLRNPRLNKGTAFTEAERRAYGLEGLLPPAVTKVELQVARRHAEIADLGAGGMGIRIGKLARYTAWAGVPPQYCLPVVLDVGTNNTVLLEDPFYLGLRQNRVRGAEYTEFVDEFVAAVQALYPKCCIQWEDFANLNAVPILSRYRDKVCTYNDDIQGTAGVALAGILAASRITGTKLADQRLLFLGGGSAGTGIAELISQTMARGGGWTSPKRDGATHCSMSTA